MAGKSKLTADAAEQADLARPVEIGAARRSGPGAGDPADAGGAAGRGDRRGPRGACQHGAQLAGYFAHGGVAGLRRRQRPGQQAKIGPHAGAIAAAILTEDTRHDGGWTLPRLCAEIARRGGPAISPRWLSHQLRQRGCVDAPHGSRALLSLNCPVDSGFVSGLFAQPHGRWPRWVSASRSSHFTFALNAHPLARAISGCRSD